MEGTHPAAAAEASKPRKLPEIPAEELALHGKPSVAHGAGGKMTELPPEIHVQLLRHMRKRSRSLTGLDAEELEKRISVETQKENVSPEQDAAAESETSPPLVVEGNKNLPRSLPCSPMTNRKGSISSLKSLSNDDKELVKELRWHYKQYVKASKRKKDNAETGSVRSSGGISLHEGSSSVIRSNRCDQCNRNVDILERVAVENHVFHKSCFLCAICSTWLNHFNYCFVPEHDKFYCIQHYQDIESATVGLSGEIRHAMGIGPGVNQQFKFVPDGVNGAPPSKEANKTQNSVRIMKEKISLLSKRGKKMEKKAKKLKANLDKFKGPDSERNQLFMEWFGIVQEKNSAVRREAELTFTLREIELSEKYTDLEKRLRVVAEKEERAKTEYDKVQEKELLQEMLEVVEKREKMISDKDAAQQRYLEEDKELEKEKADRGVGANSPDVVKDAAEIDKEAVKVSEALRNAPLAVKNQSDALCCVLL